MRTYGKMIDYGGAMIDSPCETVLLGRIGSELALVYHDTLQSPLPADLRELVDRLGHEPAEERPDDRDT